MHTHVAQDIVCIAANNSNNVVDNYNVGSPL